MNDSKILLVVLVVLQSLLVSAQVNFDTLRQVHVIIRHGERVPEYPYPKDPYNSETFWKEGWGQMTEKGKKQEYDLGQYLRDRYKNFIAENFVPKEIYVLSSETDRTIMSAQLALAGMYPTRNGTSWNPELKWQPVPVYTIPEEFDNVIRNKKKCPRYDEEKYKVFHDTPEAQNVNVQNRELFEYLSNNSGVNITGSNNIDDFYATMMVEEMLGLDLPEWAVPVVHTENFQYLYNQSFGLTTSTQTLKRFRTGPLLGKILWNLHERISNNSMKTKFLLYSAHDTTLINVLNTLDIWNGLIPYYSSALMIEMHRNTSTNEHYLNFYFRNETDKEPYKLQLPICDFDCLFTQFEAFVKPLVPEDWDSECLLEAQNSTIRTILKYMVVGVVGLVILGFIYFLVSKVICKASKRNSNYIHM